MCSSDLFARAQTAKETDTYGSQPSYSNRARKYTVSSCSGIRNPKDCRYPKKYRALYIVSDNVILKNLKIINGKLKDGQGPPNVLDHGYGGAICWEGNNGSIIDSTIENNEIYGGWHGESSAIY